MPRKSETKGKTERGQIRTMTLPVELLPEEVRARAKHLTGLIQQKHEAMDRLENHMKATKGVQKQIEGEIEALEFGVREVATVVRNEREDREVEVYDESDHKTATVYTKRADNDELVASRGMTEAERQRSLFVGGAAATAAEA